MKTFEEWSRLGYIIKRGSKATWVDDIAMFDETQVFKSVPFKYSYHRISCSPYSGPSYHWGGLHSDDLTDYMDM